MTIPVFKEISDLHQAAGNPLPIENPAFYMLRYEDLPESLVQQMPAYRNEFYCLHVFSLPDTSQLRIHVNEQGEVMAGKQMVFSYPGQVLQWRRTGPLVGYSLQFKSGFLLADHTSHLGREFPFFRFGNIEVLTLELAAQQEVNGLCEKMLREFRQQGPDYLSVLRHYLFILLYRAKHLYQSQTAELEPPSWPFAKAYDLTQRFQELIWEHLGKIKLVEEYARLLGVTAKYLSDTVWQTYGKSATQLMQEIRILAAQNLLEQTDLTVTEIADELGFSDQSNFTKVFKKITSETPLTFRKSREQSMQEGKRSPHT